MSQRDLLLLGSGGLAREVLAAAASMPDDWCVLGMLDDDAARHGTEIDGVPVLGGTELVHDYPDAALLACVASAHHPAARRDLVERLELPPWRWATFVHPTASVPAGTWIGEGTVLLAGVVVTAPQRVGAHVLALPQVLLSHDDDVDDFVSMAGQVALGGRVRVGEAAYVGAGAQVREGVRIGPGAVVGIGSVVLSDVPAGETWTGAPARRLEVVVPAQASGHQEES